MNVNITITDKAVYYISKMDMNWRIIIVLLVILVCLTFVCLRAIDRLTDYKIKILENSPKTTATRNKKVT